MESPPTTGLVSYTSPHDTPQSTDQHEDSNGPSTDREGSKKEQDINRLEERSLDTWVDTRSSSNSLECLVNPPFPSELGEADSAMLRGDAIGDTTYTQRWVLNTLVTITKALPEYLATDEAKAEGGSLVEQISGEGKSHLEVEECVETVDGRGQATGSVLELAEDVENASCQLWDMTAERDVVLHLLDLSAIDILQLANDIITLSRAPRLTEVVVGVVANICCQAEGCMKVINHQPLLTSSLTILQATDDVPTMIECVRLLQLLLWHLTYRVLPEERSRCPLVAALKTQESLKVSIIFILRNSLKDNLLSSIMTFLEALLYVWLPADQCYMALYYADSGLVEGVVEVIRHFLKAVEVSGGQDLPKEVHQGILILYSFVATPAAHIISSFDQYESLLEPILVSYVEHLAKVEDVEELLDHDTSSEKLTYVLGLCELLVPTMRHPNILLSVGKLLALTHGATHHYTTRQTSRDSTSDQGESVGQSSKDRQRRKSRTRSRRSLGSLERMMEIESGEDDRRERRGDTKLGSRETHMSFEERRCDAKLESRERRMSVEERRGGAKLGSRETRMSVEERRGDAKLASRETRMSVEEEERERQRGTSMSIKEVEEDKEKRQYSSSMDCNKESSNRDCMGDQKSTGFSGSQDNVFSSSSKSDQAVDERRTKLRSLVDSLSDFCVRIVKCSPNLSSVLTTLNECHAHEVQLFFRAVRTKEPVLVGQLQEQLLDTGEHNRLVTILADMYA